MTGLVVAEHNHKQLSYGSYCTITAALQVHDHVDMLLAGYQCNEAVQAASEIPSVNKVFQADGEHLEHHLPENVAPIVADKAQHYSHVWMPAGTYGKNVLPRAAVALDMAQVSDIVEVVSYDTFVRPIYTGNALAKVQSADSIKFITVRATAFEPAPAQGGNAEVESIAAGEDSGLSKFLGAEVSQSDRPDLTTADIVVSGGRGMGAKENFDMLKQIADKLNAAIGASRAAVDAGFVPNDYQVGQTGKYVAPKLYIAVGLSGAIQHMAGMRDSKYIVAINKDPDAPIFKYADYGLVADLFDALPKLSKALAQITANPD
jgi:electron transfer flavoprotein alpha subunit